MTDTLYGIWGSTLTGIANAIRTKNTSVSGLVDPADMAQDILDIPSGGGGGTTATSIDIVTELPSTLVEGAVYLIPNGEQVVPPLPLSIDTDMNRWAVIANINSLVSFPYVMTKAYIKSCNKFYAYAKKATSTAEPQSFVSIPSTRGSYPGTITMNDGNSVALPTYIYKYEPATDTDWVDITSTISQADWESNVVDTSMLHCIYSTVSMIRRSLNHIGYEKAWNSIDTNGKLIKMGEIDEYNVYYVESGIAVSQGSHTLKWVANNYS